MCWNASSPFPAMWELNTDGELKWRGKLIKVKLSDFFFNQFLKDEVKLVNRKQKCFQKTSFIKENRFILINRIFILVVEYTERKYTLDARAESTMANDNVFLCN